MKPKPRLRLVSSQGMTPAARADEAAMEVQVIEREARAHVAHLRLLAKQLPLFEPAEFQRLLLRETEKYARKWTDEGEAA